MSTVDSIFSIVILHICMSFFLINIVEFFCKPQSKLDLPTLRLGSRERKNATEQIKNMTLARIFAFFLYLLPWQSVGRSTVDCGFQKNSTMLIQITTYKYEKLLCYIYIHRIFWEMQNITMGRITYHYF